MKWLKKKYRYFIVEGGELCKSDYVLVKLAVRRGSKAETAGIETFERFFCSPCEEVTREEYDRLRKEE